MSFSQSETGKDSVQISAAGTTGSAEPTLSEGKREPETVTVSLPALRAVVLTLIDDGWQCADDSRCDMSHEWAFPTERWPGDESPTDDDIALRELFVDKLTDRLRQLPARG